MVEFIQVAKSFFVSGIERKVLRDITFSIAPGTIVAVTGISGAGKSTLLTLAGGLDVPTSGTVLVGAKAFDKTAVPHECFDRLSTSGGRPGLHNTSSMKTLVSAHPAVPAVASKGRELVEGHERNISIGYVFQQPLLVNEFTVLENVMLKGWAFALKREDAENRAQELLHDMRCDHVSTVSPVRLSGGEQRRVAVARALFARPQLLLVDEPTAHLDEESAALVREVLVRFCRETGATALISTHDHVMAQAADRILRMHEGLLIQ